MNCAPVAVCERCIRTQVVHYSCFRVTTVLRCSRKTSHRWENISMLESAAYSAYDRSAKVESANEAIEELPMQTAVELHVTWDWGIR